MAYPYLARPDDELAFLVPGLIERGQNRMQNWVLPDTQHPPATGRYHLFFNGVWVDLEVGGVIKRCWYGV